MRNLRSSHVFKLCINHAVEVQIILTFLSPKIEKVTITYQQLHTAGIAATTDDNKIVIAFMAILTDLVRKKS